MYSESSIVQKMERDRNKEVLAMTNEAKMMQLLEEINTRLIKVEVTQENTVIPRIQALAEGVSAINDLKKAQ